ncbi:MAG: sulfatase [Candidatus Nanoarchaeia archaeon]|nr:sulfatase [Candidatus Nanoarchaeia archaeon]
MSERLNVLIISIDTLRKDKLGVYGNKKNITPNIDSFAKTSIVFDNAYSTGPWTGPGFGSMLSSKYPSDLGYTEEKNHNGEEKVYIINNNVKLIQEVMKEKRYMTACFQGNSGVCYPEAGYGRGFDVYETQTKKDNTFNDFLKFIGLKKTYSAILTEKAKKFMNENRENNFFVWINLMEPHVPYAPFKYINKARFISKDIYMAYFENNYSLLNLKKNPEYNLSYEEKIYVEDKYDMEVKIADDFVGNILNHMKKTGLLEKTIIIFCSDHGEEFWEHGDNRSGTYDRGVDHGHTLYNELVNIPLILRIPYQHKKIKNKNTVSIMDIAPTIIDLTDNDSDYGFDGIPLIKGNKERKIFMESIMYGTEKKAVIKDNIKVIYHPDKEKYEIYNIEKDPNEKKDISHLNDFNELKSSLLDWIKRDKIKLSKSKISEKGEKQMKQRLKDLGYF